ncbi:MAG: serine/threonine protein kinase, partial [Gemmatimonadaceae bacterium]|nr:serine/threonine protein kinase [Gemmatimonadaceae bacterium]
MSDDQIRERVAAAVAGQYEIEAEIGRGGMAVVYRARDVRLKRRVALKILPPELAFRPEVKSRFLREAQTAAQLNHPHIVPIYAVDEAESIVFFAMGLVEGETLAQQLAREPRPAIDVVRRVLCDVCEALAYAHAHGVVHRDIKPDNILIDRASGRALVSDFGIARAAAGDLRLTATGIAVGTPTYMSPEQAMGEREVDGRSDLYALGIVGYHMIAGEPPFQATNTPAMLMKHISEAARPLHDRRADVPANLVAAIDRAMAKGPDERWPDAHAFRDALAVDAPAAPRPRRAHPATAGVDAPASSAK